MTHALDALYKTVVSRRNGDPEVSYSAKLFARGRDKIAQKFGEEAVETIVEAVQLQPGGDRTGLVAESADLLYHLMVLWADAGVAPKQVWAELERRKAQSGLDEKAARA